MKFAQQSHKLAVRRGNKQVTIPEHGAGAGRLDNVVACGGYYLLPVRPNFIAFRKFRKNDQAGRSCGCAGYAMRTVSTHRS
jgi:hypothetical protein